MQRTLVQRRSLALIVGAIATVLLWAGTVAVAIGATR